jgi:hypothetical protein
MSQPDNHYPPTLIELWKNRKLRKLEQELEEMKIQVEIAKLANEINEIHGYKNKNKEVKHE